MSNYENWQMSRFGNYLPDTEPQETEEEVKECLNPNMETGGVNDDEFLPIKTEENE